MMPPTRRIHWHSNSTKKLSPVDQRCKSRMKRHSSCQVSSSATAHMAIVTSTAKPGGQRDWPSFESSSNAATATKPFWWTLLAATTIASIKDLSKGKHWLKALTSSCLQQWRALVSPMKQGSKRTTVPGSFSNSDNGWIALGHDR